MTGDIFLQLYIIMINDDKEGKDIVFICLPPAQIKLPSLSFTVLKSYLKKKNISGSIYYSNLNYYNLLNIIKKDDVNLLLPFIYIINKEIFKSESYSDKSKKYLEAKFPEIFMIEKSLSHDFFQDFINNIYQLINKEIDQILQMSPKLIGFTSKFDQWISAIVFSHFIKKRKPDLPIVIGGWSNYNAAIAIYEITDLFDYSIWGEGEISLFELYKLLNQNDFSKLKDIPRLIFKDKNYKVIIPNVNQYSAKINFWDIAELEFDDYIESIKNNKYSIQYSIPIERSRGCNWNKCKFCFLTNGYKYQIKDNDLFLKNIQYIIEKYNICEFFIVDNDFIGKNIHEYKKLLHMLINLRKKYSLFKISFAEIITKNIDRETVSLMAEANIKLVQIGLEAISQNLLSKINKKQNVAENIFFIRDELHFGITISGANIITGFLDEIEDDIFDFDSIDMLYFFRFFISNPNFKMNVVPLAISRNSIYYKQILRENKGKEWSINTYQSLFPRDIINKIDKFSLFAYANEKK